MQGRDVVVLDPADGTRERWRAQDAAGPRGSAAQYDLLPLRRGDGTADVFLARLDPGAVYRPTALRGSDGTLRWNSLTRTASSAAGAFALGDLTGDGADDVFIGIGAMMVIDGDRGELAVESNGCPYAQPIIAPFSGSEPEVYVAGAFLPDRLVSRRLDLRGTWTNGTFSAPFGALLRCADAPAVAMTPFLTSRVVVLHPQNLPPTGPPPMSALVADATLAGGRSFARPDDLPAGLRGGTITGITAVADLDGRGTQGLLVGSTDGWLYALDACSLAVRWSMDFHAPVGEPIVADTDGDGDDDVMVSAGDGYLYGLGARTLEAPAAVRDVAPPGDDDVDEVETFDTLSFSWEPVDGATSYLLRPLTRGGTALRFPESIEVRDTRATVRELPLRVGGVYRAGVTALRADGSSVETLSDGATIVDRTAPTVTARVSRERFAPRAVESVDLTVEFSDLTGLTRSRAELVDSGGRVVRTLEDYAPPTRYASRAVRVTWGGSDGDGVVAPLGEYTLIGTATDVGGHTTTARATVSIVAPPDMTVRGFNPGASDSCACRASAHRDVTPRHLVGLAAVLALALHRRRARRAAARK